MAIDQQEIDRAKALARQGNSQAAIASLSRLIQRDARNVDAWLALAEVVEEPERVEYCLQKVLSLDPGNSQALEMLASMSSGSLPESTAGSAPADVQSESIDLASRLQSQEPKQPETSAAVEPQLDDPLELHTAPPETATEIAEDSEAVKEPRFNRTDIVLIGLTVLAGMVLCGLIGAAVVRNSLQPAESPDEVVQVVFANIAAANREDITGYMATIHPDSPGYNTTHATIQDAFATYDLSYEIFIPEMLDQGRTNSVISFVLTTRKIGGPAFRDNTVSGEMTLRKHEGEWKIYDQRVDEVQYLN